MGRRKKRRGRVAAEDASGPVSGTDVLDGATQGQPGVLPHPLEEVAAALERGTAAPGQPGTSPSSPNGAGRSGLPEWARQPDADAYSSKPEPVPDVQTLGELLQQARESRGISVEEASARTRISPHMLRHLESDRFGELAADAYVKGFLRSYGNFLGLDVGMLLRRYETLSGKIVEPVSEIWDEVEVTETATSRPMRPSRRTSLIFAAVATVAVLGWVFWSSGSARLGLRPMQALEQIEDELRHADQNPDRGTRESAGSLDAKPQAPATSVTPLEDTSPARPDTLPASVPDSLEPLSDMEVIPLDSPVPRR